MTVQKTKWPLQRECNNFYGDPNSPKFEQQNIVRVPTPWKLYFGLSAMSGIRVHKKCADAFEAWFKIIWQNAHESQSTIHNWGMDKFSGSFVVRPKRAGTTLSMHAYGCAIDFDAESNSFKDHTPFFSNPTVHAAVVQPFKDLGGTWGGDWPNNTDGMHFQFANVS